MMFPPGSHATFTLIVVCVMCIMEINLVAHYVLIRMAGVG
jgi:hypothetical protein